MRWLAVVRSYLVPIGGFGRAAGAAGIFPLRFGRQTERVAGSFLLQLGKEVLAIGPTHAIDRLLRAFEVAWIAAHDSFPLLLRHLVLAHVERLGERHPVRRLPVVAFIRTHRERAGFNADELHRHAIAKIHGQTLLQFPLLFSERGNLSVAGRFAAKQPGQIEACDLHAAVHVFFAPFNEQIDHSLAGSPGTPGVQGGVGAETFNYQAFDRPGLAAVETGPDRPAPAARGRVQIAGDQNVPIVQRQPDQPALAAIRTVLRPVGQNVADLQVYPHLSAVITRCSTPHGIWRHVIARVVINMTIGQLGQSALAGAQFGKGGAGLPALAPIVAVDRRVVAVRSPFPRIRILWPEHSGRHQEATLLFSITQSDPMLSSVGSADSSEAVRQLGHLFSGPGLAVIPTAIHGEGRFNVIGKHHDISRVLIHHGRPQGFVTRVARRDLSPPGRAAVFAATESDGTIRAAKRDDSPIHCHDYGRETNSLSSSDFLNFQKTIPLAPERICPFG